MAEDYDDKISSLLFNGWGRLKSYDLSELVGKTIAPDGITVVSSPEQCPPPAYVHIRFTDGTSWYISSDSLEGEVLETLYSDGKGLRSNEIEIKPEFGPEDGTE